MKIKSISIFLIATIFLSCTKEPKKTDFSVMKVSDIEIIKDSVSYKMIKNQCYICHSTNAVSHDVIIAPPMAAVKMRYSRAYNDKESFVDAITSWTLNPKADKALMRGAVNRFNVMPKQNFNENEIRKIATYIYENELEEPDWFNEHQKEMHGNGIGQGRNKMKSE